MLRGDHGRIEVGARTSVQDGTVVHCTHEWPTLIGADCVVGHNAHLEGCVVADGCLIGSGSITLNGVTVGAGAIVAAGVPVPEGLRGAPAALVVGVPAKIKRTWVPAGHTVERCGPTSRPAGVHRPAVSRSAVILIIDGMVVTDAHMHDAPVSTVSAAWTELGGRLRQGLRRHTVFGRDGDPVPARRRHVEAEGVETGAAVAEYSPWTTGIQPIEDLLPLIEQNPDWFRLVANVKPGHTRRPGHRGRPPARLRRRRSSCTRCTGAFRPGAGALYALYDLCAERGVPNIVHTGGSIFPGSEPERATPG